MFLAFRLNQEDKLQEAIDLLKLCLTAYTKALDGHKQHPQLEKFYEILGIMQFQKNQIKDGIETYENYISCLMLGHGSNDYNICKAAQTAQVWCEKVIQGDLLWTLPKNQDLK